MGLMDNRLDQPSNASPPMVPPLLTAPGKNFLRDRMRRRAAQAVSCSDSKAEKGFAIASAVQIHDTERELNIKITWGSSQSDRVTHDLVRDQPVIPSRALITYNQPGKAGATQRFSNVCTAVIRLLNDGQYSHPSTEQVENWTESDVDLSHAQLYGVQQIDGHGKSARQSVLSQEQIKRLRTIFDLARRSKYFSCVEVQQHYLGQSSRSATIRSTLLSTELRFVKA